MKARTALALFVLLVVLYNANLTVLLGNDTRPARYTAVSLIKRGDLDLDEFASGFRSPNRSDWPYWLVPTPRGVISRFGWGAPAVATPVFGVALLFGHGRIRERTAVYVAKLASSLAVAGAALLVAFAAIRLGAGRRAALAVALLYGLATCAFSVVSQALWQHGPAELFLALGLYLLARDGRVAVPASGAAFAALVACRPADWPFALAALAYVARARRGALLGWLAAAAPLAILLAVSNAWYLGAPWRFPQAVHVAGDPASFWSARGAPLAFLGLLVSPSRGLLVYSPFFVFLLLARGREIAPSLRYLLAGAVALVVMTAFYYRWYGGWCFGYRTVVDATPVLCVALAPIVARLGRLRLAFLVAAGAALVVHTVGAYCYTPWDWDAHPNVDAHPSRLWSLEDSQLGYWLQHAEPRNPP